MTPEFENVHAKCADTHTEGLSVQEMATLYNKWAPTYENDYLQDGIYNGPKYAAGKMKELYKEKASTVRVLDIAAGTGLLGLQLYDQGFRNIDALDPSSGMLELCKAKNVYKDLICDYISEDSSNIKTDTYDCIAISGGMGESHIPRSALPEMVRIVKPGGYICIAMRKEYLELAEEYNNNKLEDIMAELERNGRWKKMERTIKPNYSFKKEGVLFVYKVV